MPADSLATIRGRVGAYSLHSQVSGREITANARSAFLQKFEDQVDPDRTLPAAERERRAAMARKAHFQRLALSSAKARQKKSRPAGETARATATPQEDDSRGTSHDKR